MTLCSIALKRQARYGPGFECWAQPAPTEALLKKLSPNLDEPLNDFYSIKKLGH